ncbi:EAL domain-containing protein [Shewanella sp. JNE10-2]|uniref:EAL domain-containing protein n=1 Tax=unclassified Shewanella TaxID=196818 RepID=UPI0020054458|nr:MULTISPECIES: EAL domain-containing protein [unclassified Shewanella]MCK7629246.1 EAL domain-containing protein [Shewanella sp. JNE9-1]MCK7634142.1 EAL domain-containing protein [Shewanella sp. JNE17]MCK7644316.1 EAL domain-containing protein [Shewanella sp. JNE3-1]MCK7649367.1 EAL domain-containing protein [Shewanella sp. JNE8]MCK7652608.1 EAL domain-containing protein [Shewanella sp. JNE4-1]
MINLKTLSLSSEYQPFVDPQTLAIDGYEALARFYFPDGKAIAPNLVFEQLHESSEMLAAVEYQAKAFQLAHAPRNQPIFINVDPHAVDGPHTAKLLALLSDYQQITVEIIENTCVSDADLANQLFTKFKEANINVALDDIGAPHSMLSVELMMNVDYLKFDRHWLTLITQPQGIQLLTALIDFAKRSGKRCILEGIETEAHLAFAKDIGVHLVQGFLFKSWFIRPISTETLHLT